MRKILAIVFASALFLAACAPGAVDENTVRTQVALELTLTALAGGGQAPTDTTAPGDTPTPSHTPTITNTATPSIPYVSVTQNTNCRTGPSSSYGLVTTVQVGQQAEVVAVYPPSNYVVVRNPNGSGLCWLWLQYANNTDFTAYSLPIATQPPTPTITATPTPSFNWEGDWNASLDLGNPSLDPCSMHVDVSGNSFSGTYDCGGGLTGTLTGTISNGGQNASGTWNNSLAASGTFAFQIKSGNRNQFVGNYDASYAWCGARSGTSAPSPCYWP